MPDKVGERELVRQADLARLCKLAEEFDDGTKTVEQWVEWLRARFAHGAQGGVHLLTLHRAKGLEFEAVFLPRVEEKELPCKAAMRVPGQVEEERRLLYVGMTRAKRHLALTWAGKPSRFLLELGVEAAQPRPKARAEEPDDPTYVALKEWRLKRSKARRGAGVRRLPQLDAGRDRLAPAADDRRARVGARRRTRRSSSATAATC